MFRLTAAVLGLALFACSGYAQDPAQAPAASQPARAPTAQDVLRRADLFVSRIPELLRAGRSAEVSEYSLEALRDLEGLLKADPENPEVLVVLAELLIHNRDFDRARKTFKQVLEKEPANYRANLGLGRHYLDSRYPRQATGYLETAARVAPPQSRAETLRLLASSLAAEGKRVRAVSTAEEAVSVDPTNVASLSTLIEMYLEAEQVEKALERARALVESARQARAANLPDRANLEQLITAQQTKIKCLSACYGLMCKRDARGRPTEQLESGKEADAVRILGEIATAQEEIAQLNWELGYHLTLQVIEPVARYQTEEIRERLETNTSHLLNLAGLYWATHQTDRAVELFRRVVSLQKPSDPNPDEVRRNQETARQFLEQHGFPLTAPPEPQS